MSPTLNEGEIILVRLTKNVNVGDVILFKLLGKKLVKRVKNVKRDINEDILLEVTGDNSKNSLDSRKFGDVPIHVVIGKAIIKFKSKFPFFERIT